MKKLLCLFFALITLSFAATAKVPAPTLKYANAGTLGNWTEESYYNAPVVTDIDGDGQKEIVFSNYSITVLNADGSLKWKVNSGFDRNTPFAETGRSVGHTWCDAVVTDIDGDGKKEILTVHGDGTVSVLDRKGYFKSGWPQKPVSASGRSIKAADLDRDGKQEVIVGFGVGNSESVYVYNADGSLRNGWPQLAEDREGKLGFSYGIFMNNISVTDLDGDQDLEIIVPTDMSYISAYHHDGTPVAASSSVYGNRNWGQIAFYEDYQSEIRGDNGGWGQPITGNEKREELYKGEFGHGISTVADLDGDGVNEIIVSTIMCNRKYAPVHPPSEYMTIAVLNADRTRFKSTKLDADWSTPPTDLGKPLIQNKTSLPSHVAQTPVVADLNGDGKKEILFNSYNGKVHCYSVDKTEPYAWPYSLTKRSSPLFEYATPVVCRDLDFDGKMEVIFASFYDEDQKLDKIMQGNLYILNYKGQLLSKTPLPPAKEANNKHNGAMSAPVVTELDGDGHYEIVINTLHGAICVFDV